MGESDYHIIEYQGGGEFLTGGSSTDYARLE